MAKYSADTIGKFDFALESAGGTVLLNKCSQSYTPSLAAVTLLGLTLWHVSSTPKVIIQVCMCVCVCVCMPVGDTVVDYSLNSVIC